MTVKEIKEKLLNLFGFQEDDLKGKNKEELEKDLETAEAKAKETIADSENEKLTPFSIDDISVGDIQDSAQEFLAVIETKIASYQKKGEKVPIYLQSLARALKGVFITFRAELGNSGVGISITGQSAKERGIGVVKRASVHNATAAAKRKSTEPGEGYQKAGEVKSASKVSAAGKPTEKEVEDVEAKNNQLVDTLKKNTLDEFEAKSKDELLAVVKILNQNGYELKIEDEETEKDIALSIYATLNPE